MAITDLTGYTWVGNETLDSIENFNLYINYKDSLNNSYSQINWRKSNSLLVYVGASYPSGNVAYYRTWLDTNLRTITFTSGIATDYSTGDDKTADLVSLLQVNGTLTPPQPQTITLDLSTLSLPTGSHSIQIRLSDDGVTKRDSELSNAVTYVVAPQLSAPQNPVAITSDGTDFAFEPVENAESYEVFADGVSIGECEPEPEGETWVINESPAISSNNLYIINFVSNNESYDTFGLVFRIQPLPNPPIVEINYVNTGGSSVNVYTNTGWTNQSYRTVYFPEPPTGDLRTWLTNNAELQ